MHEQTIEVSGMYVERGHHVRFAVTRLASWILGERCDTEGQGASCALMLCADRARPTKPPRQPIFLEWMSPQAMRDLAQLLLTQAEHLDALRATAAADPERSHP